MPELIEISGEVKSFRYRSDDGLFAIATIRSGRKDLTAKGDIGHLTLGATIRAQAQEVNDPRWGMQYLVHAILETEYNSREAIVDLLCTFEGVGRPTAEKIFGSLGTRAKEALDTDPEGALDGIPGLNAKVRESLPIEWRRRKEENDALYTLMECGLTPAHAARARRHFGGDTFRVVKDEPYRLAEVPRIGFPTADAVARKMGIGRNDPRRIEACVLYMLGEARDRGGHCFLAQPELAELVAKTLNREVNPGQVVQTILQMDRDMKIAKKGDRIYVRALFTAEGVIAEWIQRAFEYERQPLFASLQDCRDTMKAIGITEEISLAPEQEEAIYNSLTQSLSIITGGPGSGKSTVTRSICQLLDYCSSRGRKIEYALCSPTGKAAKRLAEVTGRGASTIHRLLAADRNGAFQFNAQNQLPLHCVVVDEVSMVDISLMRSLMEALPTNARLILVGDADQLPSVGPGNVLRDLIGSGVIPTVRLTRVFRQKRGSAIVEAAHKVLHGEMPTLVAPCDARDNLMYVQAGNPAELIPLIVALAAEELPRVGFKEDDIQVLTPRREGGLGVEDLNPPLQAALNPPEAGKSEVETGGRVFRVGDRVMQLRNRAEEQIYNGDVGRVVMIGREGSNFTVTAEFEKEDGEPIEVPYAKDTIEELQHAWATTIHKAQGSEARAVIMAVHDSHSIMLQRNLLYTGLTRAKELCILAGTSTGIATAVASTRQVQRNTTLKERVRARLSASSVSPQIKQQAATIA